MINLLDRDKPISDGTGLPAGFLEENQSRPITVSCIVVIILLVIFTVLRTVSRYLQKTKWTWADILMPLSLIVNLGVCTGVLITVRFGAGRHLLAMSVNQLFAFAKTAYIGIPITYVVAVCLSKLAILDVYLKVFVNKIWRWTAYVCGGIMILAMVVNIVVILTQCRPLPKVWDPFLPGTCNDLHAQFTWGSLPNIITDVIMLVLPIPTIAKLNQSWRVKAGVMLTFLVGSLGLITSIARLIQFYDKGEDLIDGTYTAGPVLIWTIMEPAAYHFAACALTFRTLGVIMVKSWRPMFRRRSNMSISEKGLTDPEENGSHVTSGQQPSFAQERSYTAASRHSDASIHSVDLEHGHDTESALNKKGIITVRHDFNVVSYHQ